MSANLKEQADKIWDFSNEGQCLVMDMMELVYAILIQARNK